MKKVFLFVLLGLFSTSSAFSQNAQLTELQKLNQRISVLSGQGKFDEAIPLAEKIVKIEKEKNQTDSKSYAVAVANLASLRTDRNRKTKLILSSQRLELRELIRLRKQHEEDAEEAENLFRQALGVYEKTGDTENETIAFIKTELAWVLYNNIKSVSIDYSRSRIDQAEKLYTEALAAREKLQQNEAVLITLLDFADFYLRYVNFEKALVHYENYLSRVEKAYGWDSKFAVRALRPLADILRATERESEAAEIYKRISQITGQNEKMPQGNFNLSLRSKDSLVKQPIKSGERAKSIRVNILIDENGKVIEAIAETKDKSDKKNAEEFISKWMFRPFVYNGAVKKMRGYVNYLAS